MNRPIHSARTAGTAKGPAARSAEGGIEVTAPSRLHFGLLSFGHREGRQYGGVGVMVDRPALRLSIRRRLPAGGRSSEPVPSGVRFCAAISDGVSEQLIPRAVDFADRWLNFYAAAVGPDGPAAEITIEAAPPQHVGLGVGTQLGLAVAAGLNAFYGLPQPTPGELARSVGRGLRSAVGTYGFAEGGLIVERGKLPGETIAPLDCRLDLPDRWRAVLIQPRSVRGLSGAAEQQAFDDLPPVPCQVTRELLDEVRLRMLPAAAAGDFEAFGESVYRYGRVAGMCFAPLQGGAYRGPHLERLVDLARSLGVRGVGQSSWGPTLFALLPDLAAAEDFRRRFTELAGQPIRLLITRLNQTGARIRALAGNQ